MFSKTFLSRVCAACVVFMTVPIAAAQENWQWTTPTPGEPNVPVTSGPALQDAQKEGPLTATTLIVSEVFAKGSDTKGEFVELYNYGKSSIDASGLVLSNKGGKTYVLPAETMIAPGAYVALWGVLAIANSGDSIVLQRGLEELDRLEFEASMIKNGASAGRYCDIYELRFCETKTSASTPGAANMLEALKVWAEPADGLLRPGQKAQILTNIPEARILLSSVPGSGRAVDAKLYGGPFDVKETVTYWYYAQYEGQATVPQKIVFTVDAASPTEEQWQTLRGLVMSEVMVDSLSKKGWVEVYNAGTKAASVESLRLDTRAKYEEDCSTCLSFSGKIFPGAYALLELPRGTVTQLLNRQTPVQLRLVVGKQILETMDMPLFEQPRQWMSWVRLADALHIQPVNADTGWTDVPTPGAKNIFLLFTEAVTGEMSAAVLARAVYAQAAYDEDILVLRGKSLPGYTLAVFGNGANLKELRVPENGLWEIRLSYTQTKDITHLFFRLSTEGVRGLLSAPFPVPAFDAADPRQSTPSAIMSAKIPVKTANTRSAASTSPATHPFGRLPLLSSMTGTVLQPVQNGYAAEGVVIASIPEKQTSDVFSFLAQAAGALATMFLSR